MELTSLDGKFYSNVKNSDFKYIIVSDDAFKFLEKYGLKVISLDPDTVSQKDITKAKEVIEDEECQYIYTKYNEETNETLNNLINDYNVETLEFYTMTNLKNIDINTNNYILLMNNNLENLKLELYKDK